MNAPPDDQRRHLHWETALDRLELDVIRAERLLADPDATGLESWDEPELTGPLPRDLLARAVELRARQQEVEAALEARRGSLGRENAFADRVDRATRRAGESLYVDVNA